MGISDRLSDPFGLEALDVGILARAIFDSSTDGMVVISLSGRVLAWNAQFQALWRIPPAMLERRDAAEIWRHKAAFLQACEGTRASLQAIAAAGPEPVFHEFKLLDGRVFERQVAPLAALGVGDGFVVRWRDISGRHRPEETLAQAQARLAAIFENALNAILLAGDDARYLDANPAACRMLGYERGELIGLSASAVIVPGSMNLDAAWSGFLQSGTSRGKVQLRRKDGSVIVAEFSAVAHMMPGVHLSVLADITEEVRSQQRQLELRALLDLAMMDAEVAYWDADLATGRVSSVNRHWHSMLGYEEGEIADEQSAWAALVHPDDLPRRAAAWEAHLEGRAAAYAVDLRMRHKAGHWLWLQVRGQVVERDAQGKALRIIGTRLDISERKRVEHLLEGLAHTDSLTGALNRRRFCALSDDALSLAQRHGQPVALLMIDLDHFKTINDRVGHAGGDDVLRAFVATAGAVMRQGDLFARVGGEEFAALLPQTDRDGAIALAQRLLLRARTEPAPVADGSLPYTVSIGLACVSAWGADSLKIEALMQRADEALYRAKAQGRDRAVLANGL